MEPTSEQVNNRFDKLPEDLKDAILSVDTANIMLTVGQGHQLHVDQIGEMADEAGLVLMGFTPPTQFVGNISRRLKVDRLVANEIANDINEKLFVKVRDSLKKIQAQDFGGQKSAAQEQISGIPNSASDIEKMRATTLQGIEKPESISVPTSFQKTAPAQTYQPQQEKQIGFSGATTVANSELSKGAQAKSIMEKRVTEPVSMEEKKIKIDPYRESTV
ncbi:MAG: hypothetical protein WC797_03180 [Candidatus Paceibacterota bacterium]|jgi:hypothetical protein